MTEQTPLEPTPRPAGEAPLGSQPAAASAGAEYPLGDSQPSFVERPEVKIAGTFIGGLLAASILKRLGS